MAGGSGQRTKKGLLVTGAGVVLVVAIVIAWGSIADWRNRTEETPVVEVSREEIESRTALKTAPVLVAEGTVNGKRFQLIMRGFTNYFLKEAWGAEQGQRSFLGGRAPGGYEVTLRTTNFSGRISYGWRGTHGGGGGDRSEEYRDDLLPGRWLWSRKGWVGAATEHEYHRRILRDELSVVEWGEEYLRCKPFAGGLFPTRIAWQKTGKTHGQRWRRDAEVDVVYKFRSFNFESEPSEEWFAEQVKKYFARVPPRTNAPSTIRDTTAH